MNGPFIHSESSKIISRFMQEELFPALNEVKTFTVEVIDMKRGLIQGIVRTEINGKLDQYRILMKKYISLYNKWTTPDIIYKNVPKKIKDNPSEIAMLLQDWNNMNNAVNKNFEEGFRLFAQVDKMLTNQSTASYSQISLFVSTIAVAISAAAIIASVITRH